MTPLAHAAVGAAIYSRLRVRKPALAASLIALPLSFASHYLLDAIPHFEGVVPLVSYKVSLVLMLAIGVAGAALAAGLFKWDRELGTLWLAMSLWIGLGTYSFSPWRIVTALLALAYVMWQSKRRDAAIYLLSGMAAIIPDLLPNSFSRMAAFHYAVHYHVDWARRLHTAFASSPMPVAWQDRISDPYCVLGYLLELMVEGAIFFGALFLCSDRRWPFTARTRAEVIEAVPLPAEISARAE